MIRYAIFFLALMFAGSVEAATVAIVDFERAVNETTEGKAAQERLDTMYSSRKGEIDRMREEYTSLIKDYEARALILSDSAREDAERELMRKQQEFEGKYMQYQQEMQQTYMTLLSELDQKMRGLTETIAAEKGYDVVLDKAAVVYYGGSTIDMTDILIARYNAGK